MHDPAFERSRLTGLEGLVGRGDLAGAARLELMSGVAQLRPEDAMFEAMLRGWRAQQSARGLQEDTIVGREQLMRRFGECTNEYPWAWGPAHVEEWTLSLTGERRLAPSTIRGYQTDLRLFSEYLTDGRYGWATACEEAFGTHPVAVCHEWNTIAHLNEYEGNPEARPLTRDELQRFLDYADEQVDQAVRAKRKGALAAYRDATVLKVIYGWGLRRTETAKLAARRPSVLTELFGLSERFGLANLRNRGAHAERDPTIAADIEWCRGLALDAARTALDMSPQSPGRIPS